MTPVDAINAIEVVWWSVCGVLVLFWSRDAAADWRRLGRIAGICLLLFGVSDAVELRTKAWWNPWWLLAWKGTCILTLIGCAIVRVRKLRHVDR